MIKAVVGLNWGDEGKGRMVDYFAGKADCVIRYQGGNNAGHTVINERGKFAFHNFPSGVCYPNVMNIIAPGSVINPENFNKELNELKEKGLTGDNIIVSDRAILIMPYHIIMEKLEEQRMKDKKYGSTMNGIAPAYGHKFLKKGIQAGELHSPKYLKQHLKETIEYVNILIEGGYKTDSIKFDHIWEWIVTYGDLLKPYVKDIQPIVAHFMEENKNIIVEAQLGALRDITHGIYPYTTSSSTLAGYACASIPVPSYKLKEITGVTKAYSTCVGEGPFVTEIFNDLASSIRERGKEYGATTGRPRRIGYFDSVATRYGAMLQGTTEMALTCLDVLDVYDELKICTSYEINGKITSVFPLNCTLEKAVPVYETVKGWNTDITKVRIFNDLPVEAKKYVEKIEYYTGIKIKYISVGPQRDALILRD